MKIKILITLRENGQNGGPYVSHKRIIESRLCSKYDFVVLKIPRARYLLNPINMANLVWTIKKEKPDIVHIAGLQLEGFFPMIACNIAHVKTVLAVHGSISEAENHSLIGKFLAKLYEIYTLKSADMVYGVSEYVSNWNLCKYAKRFYGTIYNFCGIETANTVSSIRNELGISKTDVVIVSTGRIVKDKGFDVLWSTIKFLGHQQNVKFLIVGDGNYLSELRTEIKMTGYEKEVFLLGYRTDIDNILKGSDVFIMCSKHETLCISLLEAARNSLPLVGTNVGGIPEIISDGKNGFLVPNSQVDFFAKSLNTLILDKNLRIKMGIQSKQISETIFSDQMIEEKLDDMYLRTLRGREYEN